MGFGPEASCAVTDVDENPERRMNFSISSFCLSNNWSLYKALKFIYSIKSAYQLCKRISYRCKTLLLSGFWYYSRFPKFRQVDEDGEYHYWNGVECDSLCNGIWMRKIAVNERVTNSNVPKTKNISIERCSSIPKKCNI